MENIIYFLTLTPIYFKWCIYIFLLSLDFVDTYYLLNLLSHLQAFPEPSLCFSRFSACLYAVVSWLYPDTGSSTAPGLTSSTRSCRRETARFYRRILRLRCCGQRKLISFTAWRTRTPCCSHHLDWLTPVLNAVLVLDLLSALSVSSLCLCLHVSAVCTLTLGAIGLHLWWGSTSEGSTVRSSNRIWDKRAISDLQLRQWRTTMWSEDQIQFPKSVCQC